MNEPSQQQLVIDGVLNSFIYTEPQLPVRVKHCQGLYTRINSDLFIDDLSSEELRQIALHKEWYETHRPKLFGDKTNIYDADAPNYEKDNHE